VATLGKSIAELDEYVTSSWAAAEQPESSPLTTPEGKRLFDAFMEARDRLRLAAKTS
jgi:hypothetical protein